MEVILREHVDNLGRRGEVVKVADGYARNYLLPRKLALLATDGNKKQVEREREKFDAKEGEERKIAEGMSARMGSLEIEIRRKVGETGGRLLQAIGMVNGVVAQTRRFQSVATTRDGVPIQSRMADGEPIWQTNIETLKLCLMNLEEAIERIQNSEQ